MIFDENSWMVFASRILLINHKFERMPIIGVFYHYVNVCCELFVLSLPILINDFSEALHRKMKKRMSRDARCQML